MRSRSLLLVLGVLCLAIVAGLFFLERAPWLRPLKTSLQSPSVPKALLDYGKMGKVLRHNSLVVVEANDFFRYPFDAEKERLALKTKEALMFRLRNDQANDKDGRAFIRIELKTRLQGRARVFWSGKDRRFDLSRSATFDIIRKRFLHAFIDDLKNIRYIRIDPMEAPGTLVLKTLSIYQAGYEPICFLRRTDFQFFRPGNQITMHANDQRDELTLNSKGADPFFTFEIAPRKRMIYNAAFQKKRRPGPSVYTMSPRGGHALESTRVMEAKNAGTFPAVSVTAREKDLYDPETGIIANFDQRGKAWERAGSVSFFDKGSLSYGAQVGLRLHGGRSRNKTYNSFRLYFRKAYGVEVMAPGVIAEFGSTPVKTLVAHATHWPQGMPYNTLIAYDITKRMGAPAPDFKLVNLYLNGEKKGLYFITPHQGRRQIRAELGHDEFDMYRYKSDNDARSKYILNKYLWDTVYEPPPLTMQLVGGQIDVDLFTRHLLAIVYCGTTDNCQGTALVNHKEPLPRLHWVGWDMDHSFIDFAGEFGKRPPPTRRVWEQSGWKLVYRQGKHKCGRTQLFSRLMNEDPAYRRFVVKLTLELMNHFVDAAYLSDRLAHYGHISALQGADHAEYFAMLDDYFTNRWQALRDEMVTLFGLPALLPLHIESAGPFEYQVEGHAKQTPFSGWYQQNDEVILDIPEASMPYFSHWLINDRVGKTPRTKVAVNAARKVEVVWKK